MRPPRISTSYAAACPWITCAAAAANTTPITLATILSRLISSSLLEIAACEPAPTSYSQCNPQASSAQAPSRKEVPIAGGQNVESFELFDQLGMFQVIGTLPAVTESA
jgi:hypothetical protein